MAAISHMELGKLERNLNELQNQVATIQSSIKDLTSVDMGSRRDPTCAIQKAESLRIAFIQDGKKYLKETLPKTNDMIAATRTLFEVFLDDSNFQEWFGNLDYFIEEVEAVEDICGELSQKHNDLLTSLKVREDEAQRAMRRLTEQERENKRNAASLYDKADNKERWGIGLAIVFPIVGFIPMAMLNSSADTDRTLAREQNRQAASHRYSRDVMNANIIPGIESFVNHIGYMAGFLCSWKTQLKGLSRKGNLPARLHFKLVCLKARRLVSNMNKVERHLCLKK